jgi:SAM-dependent methyltransferase
VSFRYRLLYRLGITPWERDEVPPQLRLVAGEWAQPGRALDLGCGTGRDAVHLAQQGWTVTGIDGVPQALSEARERAGSAGVDVNWVEGDVTRIDELGLNERFDLVLDRGCFHGLDREQQLACARGVNVLAAPGAELLMFAFSPGRHGPAPRGIGADEIAQRFGPEQWELVESTRDSEGRLPPWLRNANPSWHRLRRHGNLRP